MNVETHEQMHSDHRAWLQEDNLWRDELRAWQAELKQAFGQLDELRNLFKKHESRLQTHGAAIRAVEENARLHEHAIAEHHKGAADTTLVMLARKHADEADQHAGRRAEHERLKKAHHTLVAHWSALLRALQEAAG